ncbi:hypothetical protein CRG98_042613 [Punica granatum]|uniref:Uncharacterized protein n=1 Tax=Punica granatum TaxID=22663 RepID=A0A2I0HZ65_PUNGR|nr:hypothetical protein CRG98_042613 [Punica granatum]
MPKQGLAKVSDLLALLQPIRRLQDLHLNLHRFPLKAEHYLRCQQGVLSPSLSGSPTSVQSSSSVHSMSKSLRAKLSDRVLSRGPPSGIESLALACLPVLISCKNKGKHPESKKFDQFCQSLSLSVYCF